MQVTDSSAGPSLCQPQYPPQQFYNLHTYSSWGGNHICEYGCKNVYTHTHIANICFYKYVTVLLLLWQESKMTFKYHAQAKHLFRLSTECLLVIVVHYLYCRNIRKSYPHRGLLVPIHCTPSFTLCDAEVKAGISSHLLWNLSSHTRNIYHFKGLFQHRQFSDHSPDHESLQRGLPTLVSINDENNKYMLVRSTVWLRPTSPSLFTPLNFSIVPAYLE